MYWVVHRPYPERPLLGHAWQRSKHKDCKFTGTKDIQICRWLSNFSRLPRQCFHDWSFQGSGIFRESFHPLVLSHEVPENSCLRFLELKLHFLPDHVCWIFEPRANKPLLPYESAHSKLVKRNIIQATFNNALLKSCAHSLESSFFNQAQRLLSSGYPALLLSSVAQKMLKTRQGKSLTSREGQSRNKKVAVIPYIHQLSHNLKRIGKRAGVDVIFSAPHRLSRLCRKVNGSGEKVPDCTIKHRDPFVACSSGVVYSIPLPCGRKYVAKQADVSISGYWSIKLMLRIKGPVIWPYTAVIAVLADASPPLSRKQIFWQKT